MKTEIYTWMKNLTFFYVLFQAAIQLLPEKKYEKYVRFYMGLLLVVLMLSPLCAFVGKGEVWRIKFYDFYEQKELERLEKEAEGLEDYYLLFQEKWKEKIQEYVMEANEAEENQEEKSHE